MGQSYRHNRTSVSLLNYHFVWTVRRRRQVLTGPVAERLKVLIQETAAALECTVVALEVLPDHVHLFLNCPPTLAPDQLMFRIKGRSAHTLRNEFPALLTLPSMWTRSYFVSSAGNVSSETIRRYIAEQQTR
jgi:putative transposase